MKSTLTQEAGKILEWIDWTAQLSVAKPYIPQLSDVAKQSYMFGE
jgi:hypothetical protein